MSDRKGKKAIPEGEIRRSQMIGIYGPGALVDLMDHAVVIGGIVSATALTLLVLPALYRAVRGDRAAMSAADDTETPPSIQTAG